MDIFTLEQGHAPLLVSLPHDASAIPADIAARVDTYWQPYHQALTDELARLRRLHPRAGADVVLGTPAVPVQCRCATTR
ncbi:MAG TPA: N-formylglutamate amidohydrolase [Rhodanobacteraceae bacterium]